VPGDRSSTVAFTYIRGRDGLLIGLAAPLRSNR
jgi:hypothetical protein